MRQGPPLGEDIVDCGAMCMPGVGHMAASYCMGCIVLHGLHRPHVTCYHEGLNTASIFLHFMDARDVSYCMVANGM